MKATIEEAKVRAVELCNELTFHNPVIEHACVTRGGRYKISVVVGFEEDDCRDIMDVYLDPDLTLKQAVGMNENGEILSDLAHIWFDKWERERAKPISA